MSTMAPPTGSTVPKEDMILPVVFIIMDICIIISNTFILYVVIRNSKAIRLHLKNRAAHLLTVNLCTADLFLAAIDIYYILTLYMPDLSIYLIHHRTPCLVTLSSYITGHMASGFTLVAIAVERYFYVVHALQYGKIMSSRRTLLMIGIVWGTAICGTLPLYFWNNWEDSEGQCHAVNIIPKTYAMIATVGRILFIIISITILHSRIHRQAMQVHERSGPLPAIAALKTRSARVVLIIFCAYIVSWLPYLVVFVCRRFDVYVPSFWFKFAECLITLNYFVNPFIYALHNRPIQRAIVESLRTCRGKFTICDSPEAVNTPKVDKQNQRTISRSSSSESSNYIPNDTKV